MIVWSSGFKEGILWEVEGTPIDGMRQRVFQVWEAGRCLKRCCVIGDIEPFYWGA
jgi:hypothetical protein